MDNVFVIECKNQNLSKLRSFINGVLEKTHVDETTSFQLVMAIDELCANIIEHAESHKDHSYIKIEFQRFEKHIVVKIIDDGTEFNPMNHKPVSVHKLTKNKANGGLGLAIVHKFIDKIEYQVQNTLNVCTLYKNLMGV